MYYEILHCIILPTSPLTSLNQLHRPGSFLRGWLAYRRREIVCLENHVYKPHPLVSSSWAEWIKSTTSYCITFNAHFNTFLLTNSRFPINLFFPWRMPSSGMWSRVDLVWTDVTEECIASVFRVENPRARNQREQLAGSPLSDFSTLKTEAIRSSETSDHTISKRRHIPEDDILHSHRRENLKSYIFVPCSRLKFYMHFLFIP
jgi:hypothetical protein